MQARPEVGEPAQPVLQPAIGVAHQLGVEAGPGHDSEVLAVDLPEVEGPPPPRESDLTAAREVLRDAEVVGEQVGRTGGDDRHRHTGAGKRVARALHHPVAAPHDHQVGARP